MPADPPAGRCLLMVLRSSQPSLEGSSGGLTSTKHSHPLCIATHDGFFRWPSAQKPLSVAPWKRFDERQEEPP